VLCLAVLGDLLISADSGGTIKVWSCDTAQCLQTTSVAESDEALAGTTHDLSDDSDREIRCLCTNSHSMFFSGGADGIIRVRDRLRAA